MCLSLSCYNYFVHMKFLKKHQANIIKQYEHRGLCNVNYPSNAWLHKDCKHSATPSFWKCSADLPPCYVLACGCTPRSPCDPTAANEAVTNWVYVVRWWIPPIRWFSHQYDGHCWNLGLPPPHQAKYVGTQSFYYCESLRTLMTIQKLTIIIIKNQHSEWLRAQHDWSHLISKQPGVSQQGLVDRG